MSATAPADPGATPTTDRALAPDLARGGMLLLIALANVHVYVFGAPAGSRSYPRDLSAVDAVIAAVQLMFVDGRAYPLFALLFGYGIVQLAWRRAAVGMPAGAVVALVRRRGWWMLAIGFVHALLLWAGDIVGAYGLIAVLTAGMLVAGTDRALVRTAVIGALVTTLFMSTAALAPPDATSALPSMGTESALAAVPIRLLEWVGLGVLLSPLIVFGAVALGAWAARRRILDEPARHRRLLVRVATTGITLGALGGLPLALIVATGHDWGIGWLLLAGSLHGLSGYAGAAGYAALFGLLAIRLQHGTGAVTGALQACGQRSLSCYLAQSVAFAALLPAWSLGLGFQLELWKAALVGFGTWLVILLVAAWSSRAGHRGPAEVLLRRLTYGPARRDRQAPGVR
ncbi:MAG: DUF418 domain-containing protein [Pseudonocardia sp.]